MSNVTATDNTIDLDTLARVTGGQAAERSPQGGICGPDGCIPRPFPRPNPFPRPFPGPLGGGSER